MIAKLNIKKSILTIIFFYSIIFPLFANSAAQNTIHLHSPLPYEIQNFIHKMVVKYHFNGLYLQRLFYQAEILPPVISSIKHPLEKKNWDFYRHFFIKPERIQEGAEYYQQHYQVLHDAQQLYQVSPQLITAIIGVESSYGKHSQHYQALGALTTLAFYHNDRKDFFQRELEQYLLLTRENRLSPAKLRGSYAGALGIPQFMPSTYRSYAVSYHHHRKVDLLQNHDDAITSIAHFLHRFGYQANQLTAVPVTIRGKLPSAFIYEHGKPNYQTIATLKKYGVDSKITLPADEKASILAMDTANGKEYWLAFPNFFSIMYYNHSPNYALAVYLLSQQIKQTYEQKITATSTAILPAR